MIAKNVTPRPRRSARPRRACSAPGTRSSRRSRSAARGGCRTARSRRNGDHDEEDQVGRRRLDANRSEQEDAQRRPRRRSGRGRARASRGARPRRRGRASSAVGAWRERLPSRPRTGAARRRLRAGPRCALRSRLGRGLRPGAPCSHVPFRAMPDASPRPRVLLVITLAEVGGAQSYVAALLPALAERYDVVLAAHGEGPLREAAARAGVRFVPLEHVRRPISPLRDLAGLVELTRLLRRERPRDPAREQLEGRSPRPSGRARRRGSRSASSPSTAGPSPRTPGLASLLYRVSDRLMAPLTTVTICVSEHELAAGLEARHVQRRAQRRDPQRGRRLGGSPLGPRSRRRRG